MTPTFEQRLLGLSAAGDGPLLAGGLKGLEKESLRVGLSGELARTPHPRALGAALTNRYITTDFSEALLEFVTPAHAASWETHQFLCDLHRFAYDRLGDELLWVASMPCRIGEERRIPLARYGRSNIGRMKTIYRRGLGYRYGRAMQTIAGMHFNYSLPPAFWPAYRETLAAKETGDPGQSMDALRSDTYFGLIRNFRRFGWLLLYLFGASPALCRSFVGESRPSLPELDAETLFEPYATSLRMSDLGYSNKTQAKLRISLNRLDEYVADLTRAIEQPNPEYEAYGVRVDGRYRQLNANVLQIENEYYSPIRPKRVARSGERPTRALLRGGVEYVEVRSLDLNIFDPVGANLNQLRFIEAFLIYCLLEESPPLEPEGLAEAQENHALTARAGRDPSMYLRRDGRELPLADWAGELCEGVAAVAERLDRENGDTHYGDAVAAQAALVRDPEATPSGRLLGELVSTGQSFVEYALAAAVGHRDYFAALVPANEARIQELEREAADSHRRQREVEAADELPFEEFLARYFAQ